MSVVTDVEDFWSKIEGVAKDAWTTITKDFSMIVSTFGKNLISDVEAAGPTILNIIVTAALPVLTSGSPISAALSIVLAALEKEGIAVADHVLHATVAAVAANLSTPNIMVGAVAAPAPVVQAASSPASNPANQ